jgi:hypothetical protein
MNIANGPFHALQGVARSVQPTRINITPAVSDFAGQNSRVLDAICRIGNAFELAAYVGSNSAAMLNADDFELLKRLVEHLNGEFAIAGVLRRDTAVDQQHSPDESHFLDRERI